MSDLAQDPAASFVDEEERASARRELRNRVGKWVLPVLVFAVGILAWDWIIRINEIPHYILPGPGLVFQTLIQDRAILLDALMVTLQITLLALLVAVIGGAGLAILFNQSRFVEMSFYPYAVVLQVTPIVAIAPLILIYAPSTQVALLICAWIVAFFPILSNTTLGLNSVDRNLLDLFKLNGASRWQTLWHLRLPASMPYFLGGLKIAGGLALIGAVVAEFVAGASGQSSGLASRIIEAGYRLNAPRLFAALIPISFTGIVIFLVLSFISNRILRRWHESALTQEH